MILALLTLLVALTISAVAAYYSIIGLIAIFSAAVIPIAVMGVVLEAGKLITASWLYQNWKTVPKLLKGYLSFAVVVLMFITSMGIFGFLSKAHIEQTTIASDNSLDIQLIESKIERKYTEIERAEDEFFVAPTEDITNRITEAKVKLNKAIKGSEPRILDTEELRKASSKRLDLMIKEKIWLKKK